MHGVLLCEAITNIHRTHETGFARSPPSSRKLVKGIRPPFSLTLFVPMLMILFLLPAFVEGHSTSALAATSTDGCDKIQINGNPLWAGFAICQLDTNNALVPITTVSGSWNIPNITCGNQETSVAGEWIGIDGDGAIDKNSNTIEQVGTAAGCTAGAATYWAWVQFYVPNTNKCPPTTFGNNTPAGVKTQALPVTGGDAISAIVTYNAKNTPPDFTLSITDTTTNKMASFTGTSNTYCNQATNPPRTTAEWIVEVQAGTSSPSKADAVTFSKISFTDDKSNTGTITTASGQDYELETRTDPQALPKPPNNAGDSFTVNWSPKPQPGPSVGGKNGQEPK